MYAGKIYIHTGKAVFEVLITDAVVLKTAANAGDMYMYDITLQGQEIIIK